MICNHIHMIITVQYVVTWRCSPLAVPNLLFTPFIDKTIIGFSTFISIKVSMSAYSDAQNE